MSLLATLKNFFGGNGFEEGSRVRTGQFLKEVIRVYIDDWEKGENLYAADRFRLALHKDAWGDYAYKYYDPKMMGYGEIRAARDQYADNVPDCDEFALAAEYCLVVEGTMNERFEVPPAVGQISYKSRRLKSWHRANVIFLAGFKGMTLPYIFEPQTGKLYDFRDEVGLVRWVRI